MTNYNETYNNSNSYNGHIAIGYYELFIDSELVHTSSFGIEPEKSEKFVFEWISTANYHDFSVKVYVNENEVNKENNDYTKSEIFNSERKSGFLPNLSAISSLLVLIGFALLNRSKPN